MKLDNILEMTGRTASYQHLELFVSAYETMLKTAEHCGDIERVRVYKKETDKINYILSPDGVDLLAYFTVSGNMLVDAYVIPEMRRQNLFAMFLLFLKRNENIAQITLGTSHSDDTVAAVNKIYKRFTTSWTNGKQKIPYTPDTASHFYSTTLKPTEWSLVLESVEGQYVNFQKFYDVNPINLESWYHPYLECERGQDPETGFPLDLLVYNNQILFGPSEYKSKQMED